MPESRYARHQLIPNWSQHKLFQAKVAVVGCGALGNEVLKNLALLGVGQIWVVDYDIIEIHNLTRSVLFRESDIGKAKTEIVAERVKQLNSDVVVHRINGKLELAFGRGLLRKMDVVFGCLDSIVARRELNKRCYFAGVPWIDGGISHQGGNIGLYDPRNPETACYRCRMNASHWKLLNERYSCGLLKDSYEDKKIATTIMTSSVIAAYMVEFAIQLLLGNSKFKAGTQLWIPLSQLIGFNTIEFEVNSVCPDHSIILDGGAVIQQVNSDNTPIQIASELGLSENWRLELPFDFLSKFTCHSCGKVESIRKPIKEVRKSQTNCSACGAKNRQPTNFFTIDKENEDANAPFSSFCLSDNEIVQYIDNEKKLNIEIVN